ncbi:MAG TPA: UTRA domain-containing protein [Micromonospora sp.]
MSNSQQSSTSSPYLSGTPGDMWAADAAARGKTGTQRLLTAGLITPPQEVRQALHLAGSDQAVIRRRLILEDEQPVELADSYYPAVIAASTALAEMRKIKGGAVALLTALGHAPHTATERITARIPTPTEQRELDITEHEPLIVLARTVLDATGTPVEHAINRTVASRSPGLTYRVTIAA